MNLVQIQQIGNGAICTNFPWIIAGTVNILNKCFRLNPCPLKIADQHITYPHIIIVLKKLSDLFLAPRTGIFTAPPTGMHPVQWFQQVNSGIPASKFYCDRLSSISADNTTVSIFQLTVWKAWEIQTLTEIGKSPIQYYIDLTILPPVGNWYAEESQLLSECLLSGFVKYYKVWSYWKTR